MFLSLILQLKLFSNTFWKTKQTLKKYLNIVEINMFTISDLENNRYAAREKFLFHPDIISLVLLDLIFYIYLCVYVCCSPHKSPCKICIHIYFCSYIYLQGSNIACIVLQLAFFFLICEANLRSHVISPVNILEYTHLFPRGTHTSLRWWRKWQ